MVRHIVHVPLLLILYMYVPIHRLDCSGENSKYYNAQKHPPVCTYMVTYVRPFLVSN